MWICVRLYISFDAFIMWHFLSFWFNACLYASSMYPNTWYIIYHAESKKVVLATKYGAEL